MVIFVLDHLSRCDSSQDGLALNRILEDAFASSSVVTVSFSGISDIPSSFVNAGLVPFVEKRGSQWLKSHLRVVGATKQVADMIRRCVSNAERSLVAA